MKNFTQVAVPHEDILSGKLAMDVFAADLWQVARGEAPLDYRDADLFFKKTYITAGLKNILEIARARLEGRSGDSVIELQTPFGGGKTHTLIALYHKAREWNARVVVFDGTALHPGEIRPWEELERQLTGKVVFTRGEVAPGREKLIDLLSEHSPALILMDELLEYTTKAAGIRVGDSNLASQTLAFIQELTGAVSALSNALLVLTLPSSVLEHYDENAERMFQRLQRIAGRMERIYTPVADDEIERVVRARLFSRVKEEEVKEVVDEFVDYARGEGLLSSDELPRYRERFLKSYPFKPEVIDILYKRWGSFPTFQRTRGVLRLLSLVISDLLDKNLPFIRLGDFNLNNQELRRELIKHLGQEWDSIIAQDITAEDSGASKVNEVLGPSYRSFRLGTVVSTTIFMTSFSGRGESEKGISVRDIKLSVLYPGISSTVVDTVISNLKEKLFYLSDEGLFFTNQPNLNRVIVEREESFSEEELREKERKILEESISRPSLFRVFLYPRSSRDIPDTPEFKLVILNQSQPEQGFLETCGEIPRVYRNTLIFLCSDEEQREAFYLYLRKLLALEHIENDSRLNLKEGQKKEVKVKLRNLKGRAYEELRKLYHKLFLPAREGYRELSLGLPTYGESSLVQEIYNYLRSQGEILEKIAPRVIREKYLANRSYVGIRSLYEAFLKTPGEIRLASQEAFLESIKEGVRQGLFGFARATDQGLEDICIGETPEVSFTDEEVIVKPDLCVKEKKEEVESDTVGGYVSQGGEGTEKGPAPHTGLPPQSGTTTEGPPASREYSEITLNLKASPGNLSTIVRVVNYLRNQFENCTVEVFLRASGGKISAAEYEDKIKEALGQAGIEVKEEYHA